MNSKIGVESHLNVDKERVPGELVVPLKTRVQGFFGVERYARDGTFLGELEVENTVSAAGLDLLMNLIIGGSTDHLDASTELVVKSGAGTVQKTFDTVEPGYPRNADAGASQGTVEYRWIDSTTDVYNASQAEIQTPAGLLFASNPTTGWGSKPSTESWVYTWKLKISRATSPSTLNTIALDTLLSIAANLVVGHWDGTTSIGRIYESFDPIFPIFPDPLPTLLASIPPTLGPVRDPALDKISWRFTFGDGVANGDWGSYGFALVNSGFSQPLTFAGTGTTGIKGIGDSWTIVFELQF